MFEVLLVVIGALTILVLALLVRSRRSSGDPASSVQDFSRALSAMESGAGGAVRRGDADTAAGRGVADAGEGAGGATVTDDDDPDRAGG